MQETNTKSKYGYIPIYTILVAVLLVLLLVTGAKAQTYAPLATGTDNTIKSMTVFNGMLIAGGDFSTAQGSPATGIAKWDGASWSVLGTGTNGTVNALMVFNNELYAAGGFTTAGGSPANRIAKWNGTVWSAVGLGLSDTAFCLEVYNSALYVGGKFLSAGGLTVNRIARWNGSWAALGGGTNNTIYALEVSNNRLIVGGSFTTIGGIPVTRIASWDGSNWNTVGLGIDNGAVFALYNNANNVIFAGGTFTSAGGTPANRMAIWNGTTWSAAGTGLDNKVSCISTYLGDMYVTGSFTTAGSNPAIRIAKWTGSSWVALGSGLNGDGLAIANYDATMIIGGAFTSAGGVNANRIAKWGSTPVAVALVSPANSSTIGTLTPTLTWTGQTNASSYGLQLSNDPNFTTTILDLTGITTTQYTVAAGVLTTGSVYFWRVNASNGMGTGPYSPIWFFSSNITGINPISGVVPKEHKLHTNYPNPFNPATKIKFDIPSSDQNGNVRLSVYNSVGKEVKVLVNENLPAGSYEYNFEAINLTSGIYFYRIVTGSFTDTKRMMLIK